MAELFASSFSSMYITQDLNALFPHQVSDATINNVKITLEDVRLSSLDVNSDEPAVPGYTASCRSSNSLPDQVELMTRDARSGSSGGPPRL